MSVRGFRDGLASYVPSWLSNRLNNNVGYKLLYSIMLQLDCFVEMMRQGVIAPWPGKGTSTADSYIGANRGLIQGETETASALESRLRAWLDMWRAGSATWPNRAALAQRIHEYLGNNPRVRIVDRSGNWVTVSSTGVITYVAGVVLGWDTHSPGRTNWWSDMWIIIDPPEWAAETRSLTTIASTYSNFTNWALPNVGIGHPCPRTAVDAINGLIAQWKGAHTNIRGVVWNYTNTDFDPTNPSSIPTNGYWGPWAFQVTVNTEATPQRKASSRYWEIRSSVPT